MPSKHKDYLLTPVAVCNCSLGEEAEVSVCNSSVQLLATIWAPALPLLHLSVLGYGSHQGGMLTLDHAHRIISEPTAVVDSVQVKAVACANLPGSAVACASLCACLK